jgi:hypothetical protein
MDIFKIFKIFLIEELTAARPALRSRIKTVDWQ